MDRTRAIAQAFIDAYNRHELTAVLSYFSPRFSAIYGDCDYARLQGHNAMGDFSALSWSRKVQNLRTWLRARFAEDDHFDSVVIQTLNPQQPYVAAITAERSSDVLNQLGMDRHPVATKFILDTVDGEAIQRLPWSSFNECANDFAWGRVPLPPASLRSQALVRAFLDAYNAHLLTRVLSLVGKSIVYSDCSAGRQAAVVVRGKAALATHLKAQFHQADHFDQVSITSADPSRPTFVRVQARRHLREGTRILRFGTTLKIRLREDGDHLGFTVATATVQGCVS